MFRVTFFCRRSYSPVVRGSSCSARYCTSSSSRRLTSSQIRFDVTALPDSFRLRPLLAGNNGWSLLSHSTPIYSRADRYRSARIAEALATATDRPTGGIGFNGHRPESQRRSPSRPRPRTGRQEPATSPTKGLGAQIPPLSPTLLPYPTGLNHETA
jgi:hypothetical protein